MSLTNTGTGGGLEGVNSSTNANAIGIIGRITSTSPGASSAGVKGINSGTGTNGIGIYGTHIGKWLRSIWKFCGWYRSIR